MPMYTVTLPALSCEKVLDLCQHFPNCSVFGLFLIPLVGIFYFLMICRDVQHYFNIILETVRQCQYLAFLKIPRRDTGAS